MSLPPVLFYCILWADFMQICQKGGIFMLTYRSVHIINLIIIKR